MIHQKIKPYRFLIATTILLLSLSACNATQTPVMLAPTPGTLPQSDAEVPRISPADAKAAFDRGDALIVDVRDVDAYTLSHISGALSVPLGEIETNSAGINLNKETWIITYCT